MRSPCCSHGFPSLACGHSPYQPSQRCPAPTQQCPSSPPDPIPLCSSVLLYIHCESCQAPSELRFSALATSDCLPELSIFNGLLLPLLPPKAQPHTPPCHIQHSHLSPSWHVTTLTQGHTQHCLPRSKCIFTNNSFSSYSQKFSTHYP